MSDRPAVDIGNLKFALIEYARGRPLIWDRNVVCTKKDREDAWADFAEGFNIQIKEVRKRWEGMRRMYFHELRAFHKHGKVSDWIYFSNLDTFLRKPVEALMEKFSISKDSANTECIELSSNDESEVGEEKKFKKVIEKIEKDPADGELFSIGKDINTDYKMENKPLLETKVTDSLDSKEYPSALLPRLVKQGEILVSKTVTQTEAKKVGENEAAAKVKTTTTADDSQNPPPLTLMTTEDVRNELRKIPPIKMSTLLNANSRPLKPKYPPETDGFVTKSRKRSSTSSRVNTTRKSSANRASDSGSTLRTNQSKLCPLSKKLLKNKVTPLSSSPYRSSIQSSKKTLPVKDSAEGKSGKTDSPSSSSGLSSIVEDISEYATLNNAEDEPKKEGKSSKEFFKEWRKEAANLPRNEINDSIVKTNSEIVREARKKFLLSFVPDMNEMSAEQRVFFKAKIMNLISHQQ